MTLEAEAVERSAFSEVSALVEQGADRFGAQVHPEWTIAGRPNGGYLLAIMGRAAALAGEHPDVAAASAHFLRPPEPGPVAVETELLRSGRSTSQVRASMTQDGARCVEALFTTTSLGDATRPFWDAGVPDLRHAASFADCTRLEPRTPDGGPVAILDQVEVRLDPSSAGFTAGRPSGRGELRGWLQLPDGESFDHASLLYAVDALPPATFDIQFSGWVPTFELTVYVRALPAPGPVQILQRARLITAQLVDEACFVWDADGRLVAQATQLAGVRLG